MSLEAGYYGNKHTTASLSSAAPFGRMHCKDILTKEEALVGLQVKNEPFSSAVEDAGANLRQKCFIDCQYMHFNEQQIEGKENYWSQVGF
jgi:hypothetical protein